MVSNKYQVIGEPRNDDYLFDKTDYNSNCQIVKTTVKEL